MVRKLDLHEDAIFRHCGSAVEIMGFEDTESARPIPVLLTRRNSAPASTARCILFFMLLLESSMNPTESGASSRLK
jgi:hypothetical protein